MATYSTTAIVNASLVLCGATTISSITDDTPHARTLNSVYEIARKEFLTECEWTFSTTRSTLVTVATTTIAWYYPEEAYVYDRPTDALKIWSVDDKYSTWREEGDYIISDTFSLGARYSFDQEDVSKWSPQSVVAFIDKLCSDISYTVINSEPKATKFLTKYTNITLPKAKSANSQIGSTQQADVLDNAWEDAKYTNTHPGA